MIRFFYFLLFLNFLDASNTIYFTSLKNICIFNNISKIVYNKNIIFNLKNNTLSNNFLLKTKKPVLLDLKIDINDDYYKILNIYDNRYSTNNFVNF